MKKILLFALIGMGCFIGGQWLGLMMAEKKRNQDVESAYKGSALPAGEKAPEESRP